MWIKLRLKKKIVGAAYSYAGALNRPNITVYIRRTGTTYDAAYWSQML